MPFHCVIRRCRTVIVGAPRQTDHLAEHSHGIAMGLMKMLDHRALSSAVKPSMSEAFLPFPVVRSAGPPCAPVPESGFQSVGALDRRERSGRPGRETAVSSGSARMV